MPTSKQKKLSWPKPRFNIQISLTGHDKADLVQALNDVVYQLRWGSTKYQADGGLGSIAMTVEENKEMDVTRFRREAEEFLSQQNALRIGLIKEEDLE